MKAYPPEPHVDDVPSLLDGGHLWLQELLDVPRFRFQLLESGRIRFGDGDREFKPDDVPLAYEHAVRHVREHLDRDALYSAVDDVESVVFLARATHRRGLDYDWSRTPSVLGVDVWDATAGGFRPPDVVDAIFERLGLQPMNTFEKEVRASDFQADADAIPGSAWRDGPAAGLLVRNKTGERAKLPHPAVDTTWDPDPLTGDPEDLATRLVTDRLLSTVSTGLDEESTGFDALFERVMETLLRATHARFDHGQSTVTLGEFRSAVAARTRTWLAETDAKDA